MKGNEFLKAKRLELGLSLREVAKKAGISHVHLMRLENGDNEATFEVLLRLLDAMNVSLYTFLREIGYQSPKKRKAPGEGLEPPTKWLTATRSAD